MGTVVIGGGTGFVGSALVRAFESMGSRVWVVSRMPGPSHISWSDVSSSGLPPDTSCVINVAGQNIFDPKHGWSEGFKQNVRSSRIKTTETLARAVEKASKPPSVFITISGVGFYPPSPTAEYTEDSAAGSDFFGRLCTELEAAATLSPSVPTRRVVIRSGIVLGRSGGIIKNMYVPFYLGVGGRLASGQQFFPWIHLMDIVCLFLFASENQHVSGVLNGVSPQIITNNDFTKALGKAMWRPTLIPVPEFVLKMLFDEERAVMMTQGQNVVPKRTLEAGFQYKFGNINDACENIVSEAPDVRFKIG